MLQLKRVLGQRESTRDALARTSSASNPCSIRSPTLREQRRLSEGALARLLAGSTDPSNPNTYLFFPSFLPQFVDPSADSVAGRRPLSGLLHVLPSSPSVSARGAKEVTKEPRTFLRGIPRSTAAASLSLDPSG